MTKRKPESTASRASPTESKRVKRDSSESATPAATPKARGKAGIVSTGTFSLPKLSDGAEVHWPIDLQNTQAVEGDSGEAGQYYYAGPLPRDDPLTAQWLAKLGLLLVKAASKDPKLAKALGKVPGDSPALPNFPDGYAMFEHRFSKRMGIKAVQVISDSPPSGSKKDEKVLKKSMGKGKGSDKLRTDPYVFGHPGNKKFRSCEEMLPHLVWLYTDPTLDHRNCKCQYCKDYVKKLQKTLAFSERNLVLEQSVNDNSNDQVKKDISWMAGNMDTDNTEDLVVSLVPQFRAGEIVWVRMKVVSNEEEMDEGTSATVKGASWQIAVDDGQGASGSGSGAGAVAGSSSSSSAALSVDLSRPLWPCRVISRFVRSHQAEGLSYSYSVFPLHTNADLLGVPESRLIPFLQHMPATPPSRPEILDNTLKTTVTLATLQALRIASRIRGTETYAWHSTTEAVTEEGKAWIDKMEKLNHFKGVWFGADFLRRDDLVRLKPDEKQPERSYLKVNSYYQELDAVLKSTGEKLEPAQAAKYHLDQLGEQRTIKITGEELYLIPVHHEQGVRNVWHLTTRVDSTTEVTHADVAHRYRPGFAYLPPMPTTEVLHEGADEEGWGVGEAAEERRREGERSWHDADVATTLGLGVRRARRNEDGDLVSDAFSLGRQGSSSAVVSSAPVSSRPVSSMPGTSAAPSSAIGNGDEDEEKFDDPNFM